MRFKFPPKHRVYDYISYTANTFMFGLTLSLMSLTAYHMFRYKTQRVPEIEEEIRLFKEAQLMKEQVERESMLMKDKESKN